MSTKTSCPFCQARNRIPDRSGQAKVRCEKCRKSFTPTKTSKASAPSASKLDVAGILVALAGFVVVGTLTAGGIAGYVYVVRETKPGPVAIVPPAKLIDEKKKEPIVEEKKKEPVVEEKKKEPIVEEKKKEPVVEEKKKEPIVEEKKKEPVVEIKKKTPVVEKIVLTADPSKRYPHHFERFALRIDDITVRKIVPSVYTHLPLWHPDGKSFYVVQLHALVMQVNAEDGSIIRDHLHYEGGKAVFIRGGLTYSNEGILALGSIDNAAKGENVELMILDPGTLRTKKKIPCPNAGMVLSAPSLSIAFVGGKNTYPDGKRAELRIVDLKTGVVNSPDVALPLHAHAFQVSPDGRFFFGTDGKAIARFRIDGAKIVHEETSADLIDAEATEPVIEATPDGKHVWLLGVDPEKRHVRDGAVIKILKAHALKDDGAVIMGERTYSVSFDPRHGESILTGPIRALTIRSQSRGTPATYEWNCGTPRRIIMNPQGSGLLLFAGPGLHHVETVKRPAD